MIGTIEHSTKLRITRLIKAPRERVFAAWTTPADIQKWFGPETCRVVSAKINPRPSGEYHFRVKSEKMGEVNLDGVFREVKQPSKLVYTWNFSGNPKVDSGESQVTVEFLDRKGATEIQLTHEQLANEEMKEDHEQGWNGSLDKLERHLGVASETQQKIATNQIVWSDIPVKDLDRAIRFYSAVLGGQIKKEQHEGMTFAMLPHAEEHGVSGCLSTGCEGNKNEPSRNGPLLYFNCQGRLDQAVAAVERTGGKVLQPKQPIGPYGFCAIVLDSEGNRIALHSM